MWGIFALDSWGSGLGAYIPPISYSILNMFLIYTQSKVTFEDGKLIWLQRGRPCDTTITRHLEDNDNTIVEVKTLQNLIAFIASSFQEH